VIGYALDDLVDNFAKLRNVANRCWSCKRRRQQAFCWLFVILVILEKYDIW